MDFSASTTCLPTNFQTTETEISRYHRPLGDLQQLATKFVFQVVTLHLHPEILKHRILWPTVEKTVGLVGWEAIRCFL